MNDLRFILGMPIPINIDNVDIGKIYPMTMEEYALYGDLFGVLNITKTLYLQQFDMKDTENRSYIERNVKNFDVVCMNPQFIVMLAQLLAKSFKTDDVKSNFEGIYKNLYLLNEDKTKDISELELIDFFKQINIYVDGKKIDRDNYDYIRKMIIKCNGIRLPKQSKNKELQKWFDKSYDHKKDDTDMEDILTTVMAYTGYTPEQIRKTTIYQVNAFIARINKLKEFDTQIQCMCAGAEKIKLEPFTKHINLFEEDKISTSLDKFKQQMGGLLSSK